MRRNGRWILPRSEPLCVDLMTTEIELAISCSCQKSFNASHGDLQYDKKREHYNGRTSLREV